MSRYRQTMSEALKQVREATQKPYVSMSSGGQYNVLDKDGNTAYSTRDQRLAQDYLKKNYDNLKEVSDHEISMARGELEAIADKATQLASALQGKSDDGNPLEAWVQSKITKAQDYINSVSDYLMYNPDMKQNEESELEEKFALYALKDFMDTKAPGGKRKKGDRVSGSMTYTQAISKAKQMNVGSSVGADKRVEVKPMKEELEEAKIISDISGVGINVIKKEVIPFNVKVGKVGPGMDSDYEVEFTGSQPNLIKYAKKHLDFDGISFSQLKKHLAMEETEVNEKTYGWTLVSKAKDLAKKFKDNMTKAVDEIEKLEKGLSKNPVVYKELLKYNEQLEEKYTVVITKKDGTTMELGRYNTPAEAQRYVDQYGKGAKVKKEEVELDEIDEKISDIFKANKEGESIDDIAKRLKLSTSMVKKLIGEAKDEEEKKEEPKKEEDNKEGEIQSLKDQIAMLKQKLENEKNKAIKPEPNPETGEVPLTIGIAHAEFKKEKEKKEVKEDMSEKTMTDREKRLQRAKDMIKYYDAQKKAALKGKNKDLAKKMLKNDIEETVSIKAYKNAVDPSKKGLMISKSGGMSGTIMIKDKKELKDLETKLAQAKRLYNIKEM